MAHRQSFDITKPLVAATAFVFAGDRYEKGDPFPRLGNATTFKPGLIRRQYDSRKVDHVEPDADSPVQMTGPSGGRYTIKAPWLEKPEVVRGKAKAEERLAELREAGAPLGWIDGGSDVTVEGGDGGWYTVRAPWLEAPERVQGRAAAEARQRELHDAGAPMPENDEGAQDAGEGGSEPSSGADGSPDNSSNTEGGEGAELEGSDPDAPDGRNPQEGAGEGEDGEGRPAES